MNKEKLEEMGMRFMIARKAGNLTQKMVAERVGISQAGYYKIERGKSCTDIKQLIRICHVLNIAHHRFLELYIQDEHPEIFEMHKLFEMEEASFSSVFVQQYHTCMSVIRSLDKRISDLRKEILEHEYNGYGFTFGI